MSAEQPQPVTVANNDSGLNGEPVVPGVRTNEGGRRSARRASRRSSSRSARRSSRRSARRSSSRSARRSSRRSARRH